VQRRSCLATVTTMSPPCMYSKQLGPHKSTALLGSLQQLVLSGGSDMLLLLTHMDLIPPGVSVLWPMILNATYAMQTNMSAT
jgi:hypothetical protein